MKLNYIKAFVPLLILLVVAFMYVSRNDEKAGDKIVALAERYSVSADSIAAVEFTSEKGTAKLTRTEAGWQMSRPGDFPADSIKVQEFIDALLTIQPDRILDNLPPDRLQEYGLDAPSATILLSDDKQVLLNLQLGTTNSGGSSYYAKVDNDGAVLTLPIVALEQSVLDFSPNDFRSRQVMYVDRDKLATVSVYYPADQRTYTLEKQGDGWMVTQPFSHRGKERLIDAILVHLEDLKVDKFLEWPATEGPLHEETGLAVPQMVLTLTNSDGSTQQLSVGAPGGDIARLYATSSNLPEVFLAQQHIAEKLTWDDNTVKEDRLVVFSGNSIGSIEVRLRGADNLLVEQLGDGTWQRTKPTSSPVDGARLQSLMDALIALAPQEYLTPEEAARIDDDDLGFSEYTLKVELKKAETFKSQVLTIGKLHRRRGYFTRDSLTPGVYLLPQELVKTLDDQIEKIRGGDAPSASATPTEEPVAPEPKASKSKSTAPEPRGNGTGLR